MTDRFQIVGHNGGDVSNEKDGIVVFPVIYDKQFDVFTTGYNGDPLHPWYTREETIEKSNYWSKFDDPIPMPAECVGENGLLTTPIVLLLKDNKKFSVFLRNGNELYSMGR